MSVRWVYEGPLWLTAMQTNILSLLRPALTFPDTFSVYPLEIDDSPTTDILVHLASCVAWIDTALQPAEYTSRPKSIDRIAKDTKKGGVFVHCQAGMSRSATVVSAYLMQRFELDPMEAVDMVREKRPVIE
jgi:dual specificity phosphatase 12